MLLLPIGSTAPLLFLFVQFFTLQNQQRFASLSWSMSEAAEAELSQSNFSRQPQQLQSRLHSVDNMDYQEVTLNLPLIGNVTILEATLETQNKLIDMALEEANDDVAEENEDEAASRDPAAAGAAAAAPTTTVVDDVYGAVLWPAALTIASYLLERRERLLHNQTVLEVGTGTGLVALAAAMGGAKQVLATDYEQVPLSILKAAATINGINNISNNHQLDTMLFDICNVSQPLPSCSVFVAADVLYAPKTGVALARRAVQALQRGAHVVIGDSPGRPGRPAFLKELQELGLKDASFQDVTGWTVTGARHELICGRTSTTRSERERELVVAVMHLDPKDYVSSSKQQ
ncbi:hypothetical protein MPSEU_001075800 [Mayamaea pseudoterrestris]|nr:hypothetical protein MPSEU_001075800 [Mayamaea pseudoterrestris]